MTALVQDGQRSAALSQFQICQERLKRELGVPPSQETLALYERLQAEALNQVQEPTHIRRKSGGDMPIFLLTDIEGSTLLWDQHHQEMLPALFKHNQILEKNIALYGGRILELRGDGVKAVFEGGNPLSCLIAIQNEMGNTDWGEIGNLRIRAGLHGVPAVRKGYDYFKKDDQYYGPVLNHTARIMDAGWGGQVLVSEMVHNSQPLPSGAIWQDFGYHHLKSLDHPVHIYGLTHPSMPVQSFPPLRTDTTPTGDPKLDDQQHVRHNLPAQPTAFVGRQRETRDLITLLAKQDNPLVTLVGPGGMGKTRLALATAEKIVQACENPEEDCLFPDGVFFVPLAPLDHPDQIVQSISKALEVLVETNPGTENLERASQTTTSQYESLIGYLGPKRLLLVLDNFEHLLDGAGDLADLIRNVPSIHLLVTSRERLQLREEQVYLLHGLDFPDWEAPEDPCDYTAMQLFLQSAQRQQPDFHLNGADMVYLARICQLVGGMPLGLELAASWVDLLSVAEIAGEIKASIDFLETEVRNVPQRHRSIRAVFDSSWGRLNQEEQCIFPRLSIFRGAFTREAAQEVAQANLRDLATFTSKSLLQYDQDTHRYQIHELLRQYGAEKLAADPLNEYQTLQHHCRFYCHLVEQHFKLLFSGETVTAIEQMEKDFANILKAWDWAIQEQELSQIDKALGGLCFSYEFMILPDKALAACRTAWDVLQIHGIPEFTGGDPSPQAILANRLRAKIHYWQGYLYLYYDHNQALENLDKSMAILELLLENGVDVREDKIYALLYRALVDLLSGDPQEAKPFLLESLKLSRSIGFFWMVLRNLSVLGDVATTSGRAREAQRWFSQALAESRTLNNRWGETVSLQNLGWVSRSLMAYDEAEGYFRDSLRLAETEGRRWVIVRAHESLGFLSLFLGRLDAAAAHFQQAVSITEDLGTPYRGLPSKIHISMTQWLRGDFNTAENSIQAALALAQESSPNTRIFPTLCAAELMLILNRTREAREYLTVVDTITQNLFIDRFLGGRIARVKGLESLAARDYTVARSHFEKSIELYTQQADDEQVAWSQACLARAFIGLGLLEDTRQVLFDALWTTIEIKGFIPLVFVLPVAVLYLSYEDPQHAEQAYQQILKSPILSQAPFFQTTFYQFLPGSLKDIPTHAAKTTAASQEDLWVTAANILSQWIQVWMESSEKVEKDA
jgi:predicted ATPase/class 3 adenylate cyclase